jgi:uncharacterized membrane protein (UPF0127 family)
MSVPMPHFLVPLLRAPSVGYALRVRGSGQLIATRVETAFDSAARRRGLLGREGLEAGCALVIAPCSSVHTAFMRFALDIVFVARDGTVVKVAAGVAPWRVRLAFRAFAVIEMASGSMLGHGVRAGDVLDLVEIGRDLRADLA